MQTFNSHLASNPEATPEYIVLLHLLEMIGQIGSESFEAELWDAKGWGCKRPDLRLVIVCTDFLCRRRFSEDLQGDGIAIPTFSAWCSDDTLTIRLWLHMSADLPRTASGGAHRERDYRFDIASPTMFLELVAPIKEISTAIANWEATVSHAGH